MSGVFLCTDIVMTFVTAVTLLRNYSVDVRSRKGGMKMPQLQRNVKKEVTVKKERELLGTLLSVMGVGLFIVLSWAAIYLLYLSR